MSHFYSRFDISDFNDNFVILTNTTLHFIVVLTEAERAASVARIKPLEEPGPGRVIKSCRLY